MRVTLAQIKQAQEQYAAKVGGDMSFQARYYARPVSYLLTLPLAWVNARPDAITLAALLFDLLGCLAIGTGHDAVPLLGAVCINIGHLLDYVDGTLAKATGQVSKFGAWLDSVCDEVVEAAIPIGIGLYLTVNNNLFLLLGITCGVLHLLGTVTALHTKIVFGAEVTTTGSRWTRYAILAGVNLKSVMTLLLIPALLVPNGMVVLLVVYLALSAGEFAGRLITGVRNAS